MTPSSLWLVRAALACLLAGVAAGVVLGMNRGISPVLAPLHVELVFWGFATLLVFGVGLHVFPRFSGRAIRPAGLVPAFAGTALAAVALSSAGLALNALGLSSGLAAALLTTGAVLHVATALGFAALVAPLLAARH